MTTSLEGIITQVNRGDVISENADGGNVFKKTSVSARPTVVCKEDAADYKSSALPKVPRTENRQKPRLPRLFRTLCCCIRGNAPEKRSQKANVGDTLSNGGANGFSSLITTSEGFMLTDQMASSDLSPGSVTTNRRFEKLLLPLPRPCDLGKKCLIIDLDETLPVKNPDFVIPVEIDNVIHQVYVLKRPFVDEFLQRIGDKFECILFTASLAKYADPVADLLDKRGVFRSRLFREACVFHKGNYVKDLNRLGRDLKRVIIVDNSPASYAFHPDNAIPVQSWFDDVNDVELLDIVPLLEQLADVDNIYSVLRNSNEDVRLCSASPTPPISETIP